MTRPSIINDPLVVDGQQFTLSEYIVILLDVGCTFAAAAEAAGVGKSTIMQWQLKGNAASAKAMNGHDLTPGEQAYADFVDRVHAARSRRHGRLRIALDDAATQPQTSRRVVTKTERRKIPETEDYEMVVIEETIYEETRGPSIPALLFALERGWPAENGRRIEIDGPMEGRSDADVAREIADDLRAFQLGAATQGELAAERSAVIDVTPLDD